MTTDWLRWLSAAAMIRVVLFHLLRLVELRARDRHAAIVDELTHAAMGSVMMVMLVGVLAPSDSRRLAVVFAAPLVWFVWRGMHGYVMDGTSAVGAPARHLVGCAAMIYMLLVLSRVQARPTGGMSGMTMSSSPLSSSVVTSVLVAATVGVAAMTLIRPRAVGLPTTPALAVGCQLTMSAATLYMLVAV